ncbi:MAG: type II toxin-antitoxin system RelE/ParE family toxin [Thermodesulfobacteriota bacterium]|nr:type II toxin-antitoxin system RelE/ParE family toxin [Thermodesulfobacteriota bacterium]
MLQIKFYSNQAGKKPVVDFLDSLNDKQAEKVLWVLRIIREYDRVPKQYFQKLSNTADLWEVRVSQGGNIFRILGFHDTDQLIILTNGFQKKTQKTPRKEIVLAEKRKKNYLMRKQDG